MREIFQIKIIDPKGEQLFPLKSGAMNNRIRAQALEKFEIVEIATARAPKKVLAQRSGNDQVVKVIDELGGEEFDLVIEDFHTVNASLWGGNHAGMLQQYRMVSDTQLSQLVLGGGSSAIGVVSSFYTTALAGAGAIGIAAATASGGGSVKSEVPTPGIYTVAVDNTINLAEAANSIVISGTKESGTFVTLTIDGVGTRILTASTEKNWSYTLTAAEVALLSQGEIEIRVTQTDAAGNVSAASTRIITLDTVLPANLQLSLVIDSGSSGVDGLTNVSLVDVVGLEAGASWEYQIDGGAWIAGSGSSFNLTEDAHVYAVRQTDIAGNLSGVAPAVYYFLDTHSVVSNGMRPTYQIEAFNNTRDSDVRPSVTSLDGSGAYVVTWFGIDSEGDRSIFLQRFDANGEKNGQTIQLEATGKTNGNDDTPQTIAVGGNGAFITVWRGIDQEGDSSIFVQLFNADGTLNGGATKLEALGISNGSDEEPKIIALGNSGAYVVVWQGQDVSMGRDLSIFVQQFNANGTLSGNAYQLEAVGSSTGVDDSPQVVEVGSGGAYVVAWSGQEGGSDEFSIYLQRFSTNGVPNGVTVKLEALGFSNGGDWEPKLAALGTDGAYAVTWFGEDTLGNYSIFVQRFNADGSLDGATTQLVANQISNKMDFYPEIATLTSDGDFAVVWQGVDDQNDYSIFVQQFNADGTIVGRQLISLEPTGVSNGRDWLPQITVLGSQGSYAVTWYGVDDQGDDSIFLQCFNPNGSLRGPQVKLEANGVTSRTDSHPEITSIGADGSFVVTWQGVDAEGDTSIFVQQFNADGSRLYDAISLQLTTGQDKWITPNESTFTLEVRYLELSEGDVVQILDAGSVVGLPHTVTASDVSAGLVTLTINRNDLVDLSPGSKEGAHRLTAVVTDLAGNVSDGNLMGLSIAVDSIALAPFLGLSEDTGGVDGVTNVAKVNVSGLETGAAWQYKIDNSVEWLNGSGSSFNLTNGTHDYRVRQTDAAGNASTTSLPQSFTLDTSPPAAVIFDPITADNILNAAEMSGMPIISGSKESGAFVRLTIGGRTHTFFPNNTTTWSYTLTALDISAMGEGVQTLTATQTDVAGNTSLLSSHSFTVDTVIATPEMGLVNDTGTSNTDGVTRVNTVNVSNLESGAIWEYQVDNGEWLPGSGSTFNLASGKHDYRVRQTDVAGNFSVSSSSKNMTLDTSAVDVSVIYQNMVQLEPLNKTDGRDERCFIGAVGSDGSYVVTWTGPNSSNLNCIFVQKFNPDGTTVGFPLVEIPAEIYFNTPTPKVSSLTNDGTYVVTWHAEDSSGSDDIILVQRFNANGTANGAVTRLEPAGVTNGFDQYSEVVNIGNNGAFVVTWQGTDSAGDTSVFVQQFNADGTTTGRNMVQLEAIASGSDGQPKIAAVGNSGAYAVTWVGANANGKQSVFVQKFNADGGTTGNTLKSLDIGLLSGDYVFSQISAIGTDGAFVVASSGRDSRTGIFSVFVWQFDSAGSPISLVQLDNLSVPDGFGSHPSISTIGSNGAYVVTWRGVDNEGDASIFVQQFNADGSITGNSVIQLEAVNMTIGDDWRPKVKSVGTDGSYAVVWHGENDRGGFSVFVQRFNADGSTVGHDVIQLGATNNANGADFNPEIVRIGTEGAFAVTWEGVDSGGDQSIFVQRFNADGTLQQDKVEIDVAAGQDRWLNAQEASVNLTIRYAELAVGDVIQLREAGSNLGVARTVTAAEVTAGAVNFVVQKSLLAGGGSNGDHPLTAVITDLAGNVSTETPIALTLKVDATIPSAPTLSTIAGDNVLNYQEYLTITGIGGAPVIVTGAKDAGAAVYLSIDGNTYLLASNAGTSWTYALSREDVLLKSAMNLSVVQRDAAGNTSEAVTRTLVIDTYAAPPQMQLAIDTGSSSTDGVTNSPTVNVVGLEVGATWKYQIDGGAWLTGTGATFSLINGSHVYNVQQIDAAGNSSDTTLSSRTFELDTLNDLNMSATIPAVKLEATNNTNGYDYEPQITNLGIGGGYVVAWQGYDGTDHNIYTQQFNANGTTTGFTPVQLEAIGNTTGTDHDLQITVIDDTGKYVVTWTGYERNPNDSSIFVQQFNANGTTTGYAPVLLESIGVTDEDDQYQQVCAVGDGKYVVAWRGMDTARDHSIFVQQFNANGTTIGYTRVQLEASDNSTGFDTASQIAAVGSNGQYAVTWTSEDSGGDFSIYVQQFNASGTTAGFSAVKLEPTGITDRLDICSQITPLGSNGDYAVTWYGQDSTSLTNIYVQRFNANGTTQGALIKIDSPLATMTFEENPQIVSVGSEGAFVVVWEGVDTNSSTTQIGVQQFNSDGTTGSSTQFEVYANTFGPDARPQVASIGNEGAYVVVWVAEDSSRPPGTWNKTIFVQQFRPDGSMDGLNRVKLDATGVVDGVDLTPQVTAVGNDGSYVVTWSGYDGADNSIYIQHFNADGTHTKSSVNVQTALGQDKVLSRSEVSVTLEVSYSGLSEGQVIEFFESGVPLGVTHTVSAADVSSGRASVVIQKDDLGGSRDYLLSVKVADLAGNFSAESPVAIALTVERPAPVISLGVGKGQLINGVQVEGKWFYAWDKNADGTLASLNDAITLDGLATTFLGSGKSGADFTAVDRTFTANGVRLALPTVGIDTPPATSTQMNGTAWSKSSFRSSSTPNSNPTYDDLLAVWDAFNGTSTGQNGLGVPPGWDANLAYWSANATSGANHYVANMHGVVDINSNLNQNFAVFQVL